MLSEYPDGRRRSESAVEPAVGRSGMMRMPVCL